MGSNALGLNVNDRRETWLFSEIETLHGQKVYRRLKFNIVQYGDDPEEFLEAINVSGSEDLIGMSGPMVPATAGIGRFAGVRMMQGRLCDVHAFDDYDAAAAGFSLPAGRTPTGF